MTRNPPIDVEWGHAKAHGPGAAKHRKRFRTDRALIPMDFAGLLGSMRTDIGKVNTLPETLLIDGLIGNSEHDECAGGVLPVPPPPAYRCPISGLGPMSDQPGIRPGGMRFEMRMRMVQVCASQLLLRKDRGRVGWVHDT
jgi:hypothetical protein